MDHRSQVQLAHKWARLYRELGLNPLPSRSDAKRPALGRYARWMGNPIPDSWLENWHWENIQLVCGVRWGIAAVDIDGPGGLYRWNEMLAESGGSPDPCSWICQGFHGSKILYRTTGLSRLPTTVLWSGPGHNEVKLIGDRSLIVVPPSIHPDAGRQYKWHCGPTLESVPFVPLIPSWLVCLVLDRKPSTKSQPVQDLKLEPLDRRGPSTFHFRSDEVLAVLGDRKVEIARSYGLITVGAGDPFLKCHAVDREDRNPSCSIDRRTGRYFDYGTGSVKWSCSFFDLLVKLDPGTFPTWQIARELLGGSYLGGHPK